MPNSWSLEGIDFINRLIQRKPEERIGYKGSLEIKNHSWLKFFKWKQLYNKALESPIKIEIFGKQIKSEKNDQTDKLGSLSKEKYDNFLKSQEVKDCFANFTYYISEFGKKLKYDEIHEFTNPHESIAN